MLRTGNDRVDYPFGVMYSVSLTVFFDGYRGGYPLTVPFAEKDNEAALVFARETLLDEYNHEGVAAISDVLIMRYDPDELGIHEHTIIYMGQAAVFAPKPAKLTLLR